MESEAMKMIREVRDADSLKRMKMTKEERLAEDKKVREWLEKRIGRPVNAVSPGTMKIRRA